MKKLNLKGLNIKDLNIKDLCKSKLNKLIIWLVLINTLLTLSIEIISFINNGNQSYLSPTDACMIVENFYTDLLNDVDIDPTRCFCKNLLEEEELERLKKEYDDFKNKIIENGHNPKTVLNGIIDNLTPYKTLPKVDTLINNYVRDPGPGGYGITRHELTCSNYTSVKSKADGIEEAEVLSSYLSYGTLIKLRHEDGEIKIYYIDFVGDTDE